MDHLTAINQQILNICQRLYAKNMLAAADGNVSFRIDQNRIQITPSGKAKAFITAAEMATIDLEGNVIAGKPSSEFQLHLEVYRRAPTAKAVVHAHPPNAIAWSIAFPELQELPCEAMSELILATGRVPIVPYARPSTAQMGEQIRAYLPTHKVMILARHGALSWGDDLNEAYFGMERIEHSAEILRLAKTMGEIQNLPKEEIQFLRQLREKIGNKNL